MGDSQLISFVARSKRRLDVLRLLKDQEKSQVSIMKGTGMYKTHTSRTLKELSEKKLILCKNPEDREYRFYKITSKGREILEQVEALIEG